MTSLAADLKAYYDQEAADRAQRPVDEQRADCLSTFVEQLRAESRLSVLEVGVGPGRDAVTLREAGIAVVGLDLSFQNVRIAADEGVGSVQGSMFDLPFAPGTFDAGWTMSTLVHVPDSQFDEAVASIIAVLRPGAPLAIGLWGGSNAEFVSDKDVIKPQRFFALRSHERAREMLAIHGEIEQFGTWGNRSSPWEYQFVVLRVPG